MTFIRNPGATTDAEDEVMDRLRIIGPGRVTGFAVADRQQAALALADRGLIKVWAGEGRDYGLVLATISPPPSVVVRPPFGGGDCA